MAEKFNNSVTDEAMADTLSLPSDVTRESEPATGERRDSELERFINEEKKFFDLRYTEIVKLVNKVGGGARATLSETKADSFPEPTSASERRSAEYEKNGEAISTGIIAVPIGASRYADTEIDSQESTLDAAHGSEYKERSGEPLRAEREERQDGKFNPARIYPDSYITSSHTQDEELSDSDKEREAFDEHYQGYKYDTMDIFARAELSKEINSFYRRQSAYLRQISKLEARQKNADTEGNISLIVEKIAVLKAFCELTVEILSSCVYLEAKGKSARFKRILKANIDKYNLLCDEYEGASGRAVEHLDYGIVDDVMAGKISRPIPAVYYYGSEDEAVYDHRDEEYDRIRRIEEEEDTVAREYERHLDGGIPLNLSDSERATLAKRKNEKLSAIKRATERDVLLVGLRSEYALSKLEAQRDMMVRSYGLDKRKMVKSIRTIERRIEKISRNTRKAVKIARENNSRYYLLCALDPADEKIKSGARRERLDALRARLNVLLSERESVNDRLIALYGGSDHNLKKVNVSRKAAKIRRKSATAMYNSQRRLAKKIDKYRVPSDMKERAFDLLNKKTQAAATADECIYKLKKLRPVGRAKRELILEIKRARSAIKQLDREIRYMLRKLKRNQERYEDNKEWAGVLAFSFVVITIGVVLWVLFGQNVTAYFAKLAEQLGGA